MAIRIRFKTGPKKIPGGLVALFCTGFMRLLYNAQLIRIIDDFGSGAIWLPNKPPLRVGSALHRNGTFQNTFVDPKCDGDDLRPDHPATKIPGALDFTTTVSLDDLRLIVMGDSVAVQMAEGLDEALLRGSDGGGSVEGGPSPYFNRTVLKNEWKTKPSIALTRLGSSSALATYRFLGMLGKQGENRWRPNQPWRHGYGGYMAADVAMLLDHLPASSSRTGRNNFDAMIFRIPHGWISFDSITKARMNETVELAHELFGVDTIIFTTIPLTNNIKTVSDFDRMTETNNMIRQFCQDWNKGDERKYGGRVRNLIAIEFGNFVQELMEDNARAMGYDPADNRMYWTDRVAKYPKAKFPASIALVCAEKPQTFPSDYCPVKNSFSLDGMHYCMETIGGRLFAAFSCLLGCVYNVGDETGDGVNDCSSDCNRQFMSLQPVAESMYSD